MIRLAVRPVRALLALFVVATCAASASLATTSQASATTVDGRIFFARAGGGFGDETLFVMNADGTGERQLTDPGEYCCGAVSPDGGRLLVMTENQPETGPIGGGTIDLDDLSFSRIPLPTKGLNLVPQAWSPDGTHGAFEGWVDDNPHRTGVYTIRLSDGRDLKRLSNVRDVHDIPSDYSPDGRQLVFFRSGAPEPAPWDIGGSLWIARTDGSGARKLDLGAVSPSWWARWSPDGTRIVFADARLAESGAIWTVHPDGSHLVKVFQDPAGRWPITPAWAPTGDRLVFALDPIADEFAHPANEVYSVRADGSDLKLVLGGNDSKRRFDWVP